LHPKKSSPVVVVPLVVVSAALLSTGALMSVVGGLQ